MVAEFSNHFIRYFLGLGGRTFPLSPYTGSSASASGSSTDCVTMILGSVGWIGIVGLPGFIK